MRVRVNPGAHRLGRHLRSRTCAPRSPTPTRRARSAPSTAASCADTIGINDQLRTRAGLPARSWSKSGQRHRRAALRHRHRRAEHAQQPLGRLVQRPAVGAADHHQAGRRQRHRDGRPHPASCSPRSSAGFRPTSTSRCCPTAPGRSAPACTTCSCTLAATIALVMLVVFLFLRRADADDRRRRHGAALARRHLRGDVGRRASRSTISR